MNGLRDAFEFVCINAVKREGIFVSLYRREPFYGGPEEGGWWGEDVFLEEYQEFDYLPDAQLALRAISDALNDANKEAKQAHDRLCLNQCEWLEARGLDDSALPEVNGPESWFVRIETTRGSFEYRGARHYE